MKKILICLLIIVLILTNFVIASAEDFETCIVTANALNCRVEPNMNGNVIKVFYKNTELKIIGASGNWLEVYDGQTQGWCYSSYLRMNGNSGNCQTESTYQENSNYKYLGDFRISYYTCSAYENGGSAYTAKGNRLTDVVGVCIAADPRVIPYYSKVYIEGIGVRTVLDCGGAIKGNKIDVLVRNNNDIPKCGVHYSKVYLIQ